MLKQLLSTGFALAVGLGGAGYAAAQHTHDYKMGTMGSMGSMTAMRKPQTFPIHAQNGSGEKGTATLTQTGDDLLVKLQITGGEAAQPVHIHKGTCAKLDPKPAYPLTTLTNGTSTTTIKGLKLSALTSGTYAINAHKSTTDIKDYVACGNLSVAAAR